MKNLIVFFILLISLGCMPKTPFLKKEGRFFPDAKREIFVIQELAQRVGVIHPDSKDFYPEAFAVGAGANDLLFSKGEIFILSSLENSIEVFEENDLRRNQKFYLGNNLNPWAFVFDEASQVFYISHFVDSSLGRWDFLRKKYENKWEVPQGPQAVAMLGDWVYVSSSAWDAEINAFREGRLSRVSKSNENLHTSISVATNPQFIMPATGSNALWLLCTGINGGPDSDDARLQKINALSFTVEASLDVGQSPASMALDEAKHTLYLAGGGGVILVDTVLWEVKHSAEDNVFTMSTEERSFISSVLVDPLRRQIYFTHFNLDQVSIYSLDDYSKIETFQTLDGPSGLYFHEEN